jgi:hypothetical protein
MFNTETDDSFVAGMLAHCVQQLRVGHEKRSMALMPDAK